MESYSNENEDESNEQISDSRNASFSIIDELSVTSIVMGNSVIEESFRMTSSPYAKKQSVHNVPLQEEKLSDEKPCSILCSIDFLGSQIIEEPP